VALTPLAIKGLALLAERPMHPYEMYQLMLERHEDEFVKVRPGSLYHAVERLRVAELVEVTGTDRDGNRPERTTYAITAEGRRVLTSRIRELLQDPVREYPHFPLALSEAHNLTADEAVSDLRRYVSALDDDIAVIDSFLRSARAAGKKETYLVPGDYLLTTSVAQRDWINQLITRIETKEFVWQPHQG
jgi:DNA-binding PadR family transcriptional regulator